MPSSSRNKAFDFNVAASKSDALFLLLDARFALGQKPVGFLKMLTRLRHDTLRVPVTVRWPSLLGR